MDLSYEELIQELINLKEQEHDTIWKQAAICAVLVERMQVSPGDIASKLNCTGKRIKNLVRTFLAFPGESNRVPELTFSHHEIAAMTDSPAYWLEQAVINSWSTREMKRAITPPKEESPEEKAKKLWAKLEEMIKDGGPGAAYLREKIKQAAENIVKREVAEGLFAEGDREMY